MAAITSDAKNSTKPQARKMESPKEVFGVLFSTTTKQD
jgi:hypothetical protein